MTIKYLFLSLFCALNILSCCEHENDDINEDSVCFEFDQRQCAYDEWAELIPISDSKNERQIKMKAYLKSKNINVENVSITLDFHEFTCEACGVCPESDRFYVRIDREDKTAFQDLDLLNAAEVDCEDFF